MNEDWQKEAPILAAMDKTNPFLVPDGYFEEMHQQLQSRITISEFDNEESFFKLPDNYFDTLTEKIISINKLEQLKQSSGSEIFSVPANYFNNLEASIKSTIAIEPVKQEAKIRSLTSSWVTYAAAASITAIISLGIYFNSRNNNIETQIAQLPADEIVNYLQLYSDAGDAPVIIENLDNTPQLSEMGSKITDQEIEQYLESNL
jgi:hypothetical protein